MDWLDLRAVQGTLKSLLQHHSSKASIFRRSAFFTVQLSHPYIYDLDYPKEGRESKNWCLQTVALEKTPESPLDSKEIKPVNLKRSESEKSLSHATLCDPMDYIVHGILQARILEWAAFPFFRESSQPRNQTQVSHIAGGFFTSWATREAHQNVKYQLN